MNAIMKLTVVTIGALSIAGGAAFAAKVDANTNPDTANYGTPPGAALKRDGSLSSTGKTAVPAPRAATTDMSTTRTVTDTSVINNAATAGSTTMEPAAVAPAPAPAPAPALAPRPDRN